MNNLVLGHNQQGRRAGLTRGGYTGPSLLQSCKSPTIEPRHSMRSRTASKLAETPGKPVSNVKQQVPEEENIFRDPDSSSDDDTSANIIGTNFGPASQKFKEPEQKVELSATRKAEKRTINASGSIRQRKEKELSGSSNPEKFPKRKIQKDPETLGGSMFDEHGRPRGTPNKKQKKSYGSVHSRGQSSSVGTVSSQLKYSQTLSGADENSPEKVFAKYNVDASPEVSGVKNSEFKIYSAPEPGSATSTPTPKAKFRKPQGLMSPEKEDEGALPIYKRHIVDAEDSFDVIDSDPESSMMAVNRISPARDIKEAPATQLPIFKSYDLSFEDSLLEAAREFVKGSQDRPSVALDSAPTPASDEDYLLSMTQRACCPMCNESVDPAELRAVGKMNIRQQERFCRSHKKKTAEDDWELKGYPVINWAKLDSRISKHHTFIKELINGDDSYYRNILTEKVSAGQDRTLMKMTSNLTPGYYGSRGLRAISENIMKKFTPLLKKRMVQDRLMSARGFTPYVQSVLVPEVAVLLIKEDLRVDIEEARDILAESVGLGELLNEEIRDVVTRRNEHSDEDDK